MNFAATHLAAALALAASHVFADDGARFAGEHGCLNCHYAEGRSAPTLERLARRLARDVDRPQAMLAEMRSHDAVNSHLRVTDESALAILDWMARGAK